MIDMKKNLKELYKLSETLGLSIQELASFWDISEEKVKEKFIEEGAEIQNGKIVFPDDYDCWEHNDSDEIKKGDIVTMKRSPSGIGTVVDIRLSAVEVDWDNYSKSVVPSHSLDKVED